MGTSYNFFQFLVFRVLIFFLLILQVFVSSTLADVVLGVLETFCRHVICVAVVVEDNWVSDNPRITTWVEIASNCRELADGSLSFFKFLDREPTLCCSICWACEKLTWALGRVDLVVAAIVQGYRFRNNTPRKTPAASCTMYVEITNDRRKLGHGSLSIFFFLVLEAAHCVQMLGNGCLMA